MSEKIEIRSDGKMHIPGEKSPERFGNRHQAHQPFWNETIGPKGHPICLITWEKKRHPRSQREYHEVYRGSLSGLGI